ncbi:MAG TPA: protein kinase [Tepidisphaeraceae bacterium]|jgi:Tol biopolymer transport system component|nr:protein kinase [Tepidisphaeraceae bacterium]
MSEFDSNSSLRHERLMDLLGHALELDPSHRGAFLEEVNQSDPDLRAELDRLLQHEGPAARALPDELGQFSKVQKRLVESARAAASMQGKRIGAYEFVDIVGEGGMGVVWRGLDTRLGRPVAIKSIPPAVSDDHSRFMRLTREARILGALSHPNVATIFGLEEEENAKYIVMELIDGESLSQRLRRGPIGWHTTLNLCTQIASALCAAHEAGIIHRDLKPGNVMIAPDGQVKVLDFGLAREVQKPMVRKAVSASDETNLLTQEGNVMGTPRYMSPEQLRGTLVDRRTDVWAFGCVLYECLVGKSAFDGPTPADIAAAILHREPDYDALPDDCPSALEKLLRRMLVKDQGRRLRDLGDIKLELEAIIETGAMPPAPEEVARASRWTRRQRLILVAAFVVAVASAAMLLFNLRPVKGVIPAARREQFALRFPNDTPQSNLARLRLAISRSGDEMAISATDGQHLQLFVRKRGDTSFQPIPGTQGAWIPTFSPDGEWIAYYTEGGVYKRRLAGGNPTRISDQMTYAGGYCWGPDDVVTLSPVWGRGLARIASSGGVPHYITDPDFKTDFAHISAAITPDNRGIVFTTWDGRNGTRVDGVNIDGTNRHNVVDNGEHPRVVRTPIGPYLLYARLGTLFAAPFDTATLMRTGPEVPIVDGVMSNRPHFVPAYDVDDNGTLMYISGPLFAEESRLCWLEKDGSLKPFNDARRAFSDVHFSRDGTKLSTILKGEVYWPHIYDLKQGTFNRIVSDGDTESAAISPDGKTLAYTINRQGPYSLWLRDLQSGTDRKMTTGAGDYQIQITWTPDSRYILFAMAPDTRTKRSLWYTDAETGETKPLTGSSSAERAPSVSPDGKWVAYGSDDSGIREVRMQRFPDGAQLHQVTTGGGDWPLFSPDGSTLYYRQAGKLMAVQISNENGMPIDRPTVLYDRDFGQSDVDLGDYTVAPDGRLLLIEPSERGPKATQVNVMLNWYEPLLKSAK